MKKLNTKKSRKSKPKKQVGDTYKFWRQYDKSDGYELMFAYSMELGNIIIHGLNKDYGWLVKDERGRIIYSCGGKSC